MAQILELRPRPKARLPIGLVGITCAKNVHFFLPLADYVKDYFEGTLSMYEDCFGGLRGTNAEKYLQIIYEGVDSHGQTH